jgi:hypothetical protein
MAQNNILMLIDAQGNYYGDVDASQMYGSAEWDDVYGAYPDQYYSGNGSGSSGI